MQTSYGTILENWQNYGAYVPLVKDGSIQVYTGDLTKENLNNHFYSILNIMRDGIETEFVQHMAINIQFVDNVDVTLSIFDYFLNLIMWNLPLNTDTQIEMSNISNYEKFPWETEEEYTARISEEIGKLQQKREKEIENTVGYVFINFILKQLEKEGKITANESENVDKNISELLNVEYKYSCRIV